MDSCNLKIVRINKKGWGSRIAGRLPVKAQRSRSRLILDPLALVCKVRCAVLPVPLQQDAEVFGAQGILCD